LLLPADPDRSAAAIRAAIGQRLGVAPGVIISDSFGRPWRVGTTNVAIGVSGMVAVPDQRCERDRNGRVLQATQPALADAAGLVMGEGALVILRGLAARGPHQDATALVRPVAEDMFR